MKKILALLLCVAMIAAIVACGGGTQNTQGSVQTTATTTASAGTSGSDSTTGTTRETTKASIGTTASNPTAQTTTAETTTTGTTKPTSGTTTGTTKPTSGTTTGTTTVTPTPAGKTFDENNIVLSFGAISDIHITGNGNADDAESKFRAALNQLKAEASKHDKNGLDAVTAAGDIADTGKKSQVDIFSQIVRESGIENFMIIPGNHDHYSESSATLEYYMQSMGEYYFKNDVDRSMISKGARHCVVGGAHFFFIEPTHYGSNCPYDKDVLAWLDSSLKQVTAENPNAYIFLFTHPMIYNTCYGSDLSGGSWYTTYLTETLSKYPQVVTFSGHLHFPVNDERSIMQTAFTSLGCGSVRYLAIERGYSNMASATVPKDAYRVSSGLLVQVDANGNLRVTRMDFSNNTTFKTPWELAYPTSDGAHLTKYSADRAEANKAPALSGKPTLSATVSPTSGTISGATLTTPAGSDDDLVHHYNVTVKNKTTGQVQTYKFLSDFYRHPQVSGMAKTLTFPLDITSTGKYTVDVVAVDSWGAESDKISCEATFGNVEDTLSAELPAVYTDFEFTGGTVTDTNGKFAITVNGASVVNTPLTFAGKTATVGALKVSNSGEHAVVKFKDYTASTLTNFYNSATGFSVEALYINYAPNGKQGIVCGTHSPGGWGLAENNGVPYFFTYVGSGSISISASKATSKTELNHIVGTVLYDSASNKTFSAIYINGELVASSSYAGKVGVHSAENIGTAFCFGADIGEGGKGTDFPMTSFALADAKIYAHALNYKQVETAYANAAENFGK